MEKYQAIRDARLWAWLDHLLVDKHDHAARQSKPCIRFFLRTLLALLHNGRMNQSKQTLAFGFVHLPRGRMVVVIFDQLLVGKYDHACPRSAPPKTWHTTKQLTLQGKRFNQSNPLHSVLSLARPRRGHI
jgi:hypothetical protein